ncbi:FAD-dependent oxidoreductase [Raoultibacter phocaeensis]|uniref:FAD-dependent oxidoreductase n=1 Tax=Raoultibacter phocaeensis TaxID=2479841 RepID=UPI00111A66E5|nr:FAD-dependent oxidoreductase [Raoultibacter phocaeensis]
MAEQGSNYNNRDENPMMLSRRQMLVGLGLGATALAAGMAGCSSPKGQDAAPSQAEEDIEAAPSLKEPTQTIEADIVVVGSGMGGMSAAVTAAEEGANVVVLEKQSILGGGTNFAEGVFGMGSDLQKEAGVNGNLLDLIKLELEFQRYIVDYTLWDFVVAGAEENLKWLIDHGVEFVELGDGPYAGIRTQHMYVDHRGSNMIAKLEEAALDLGVDIHKSTPATHLLMDGEKVVGVQAESGKDIINVNAKAVILATGSAGENNELFDRYTTRHSEKYAWCGAPGLTGDGIKMAVEAGMGEPFRLMAPIVGTTVEPLGVASHLASLGAMNPYVLWVNQDGIRFTDEGLTRAYTTSANAVESQYKTYSIVDQALFDRLVSDGDPNVGWGYYVLKGTPLTDAPQELEQELSRGSENVFKAESIADLAAALGMDAATLEKTVQEYNAIVDAGEDVLHSKKPVYLTDKIETSPFYAFRVKGSKVNMFGGIHINENVEVVREDQTVIPGLYAAGVECGGFQGETYGITVPSSCQGISLSTGRRSAKNAVKYAKG